jgi:hypothetical protein
MEPHAAPQKKPTTAPMIPKRDPNHVDPIVTNISIKRAINDRIFPHLFSFPALLKLWPTRLGEGFRGRFAWIGAFVEQLLSRVVVEFQALFNSVPLVG